MTLDEALDRLEAVLALARRHAELADHAAHASASSYGPLALRFADSAIVHGARANRLEALLGGVADVLEAAAEMRRVA